MPTIHELVTADNLSGYIETKEVSNEIPLLGSVLFPATKQAGLEVSWLKGGGGLPVALKPSSFDTKAPVRDRQGFSKLETDLPFFREGMRIGERDRQNLMTALEANKEALYSTLIGRIFDDANALVDGAEVQVERMRMQLLSTGKIAIEANNTKYDYDYNMPDAHKTVLAGGDAWSASDSDPLDDIEKWADTVETATGERPTRAVTTTGVIALLRNHAKVRAALVPDNYTSKRLSAKDVISYIADELGIAVTVYNKKFVNEAGVTQNYFPEGVFTLLPAGTLGETVFGTTPEEADLQSGSTVANVQVVNTGVAITTLKEAHPVNVQTIVSEIVLPTFPQIDKIFIATVA